MTSADWQLSCTAIKLRGAAILQRKQWTDCSFVVGCEPNQNTFHAHKLILAMASPVFEAMFYGGMPEQTGSIKVMDIQPDAFKALLMYIYTDEIPKNSFDKACELCYAAKKYMLPHLVQECTKQIWNVLDHTNVCKALEFANLFDEENLMAECLEVISEETTSVLRDPSFCDAELNTLITVFSDDNLRIDSELDLFNALENYYNAQIQQDKEIVLMLDKGSQADANSPTSGDEGYFYILYKDENNQQNGESCCIENKESDNSATSSANKEDINNINVLGENNLDKNHDENKIKSDRNWLSSALGLIRFLTMTPEEFADGPARSKLLTKLESYAILMNIILGSDSNVPIPEGFSTSRERRRTLYR